MLREKRMLKMMEKKNNEKCEFIDRTAWFTRLTFGGIIGLDL